MKDRIEIEKKMIPYSFDILLGDEIFELEVNFNERAELFTVTLYKDGAVIVYGEPVVYGVPLFQDVFSQELFPAPDIIPLDESGAMDRITWDNFNRQIFLCVENGG